MSRLPPPAGRPPVHAQESRVVVQVRRTVQRSARRRSVEDEPQEVVGKGSVHDVQQPSPSPAKFDDISPPTLPAAVQVSWETHRASLSRDEDEEDGGLGSPPSQLMASVWKGKLDSGERRESGSSPRAAEPNAGEVQPAATRTNGNPPLREARNDQYDADGDRPSRRKLPTSPLRGSNAPASGTRTFGGGDGNQEWRSRDESKGSMSGSIGTGSLASRGSTDVFGGPFRRRRASPGEAADPAMEQIIKALEEMDGAGMKVPRSEGQDKGTSAVAPATGTSGASLGQVEAHDTSIGAVLSVPDKQAAPTPPAPATAKASRDLGPLDILQCVIGDSLRGRLPECVPYPLLTVPEAGADWEPARSFAMRPAPRLPGDAPHVATLRLHSEPDGSVTAVLLGRGTGLLGESCLTPFLWAARKSGTGSPYYTIALDPADLRRARRRRTPGYLAKLRGNAEATKYVLYDDGEPVGGRVRSGSGSIFGGRDDGGADVRHELLAISVAHLNAATSNAIEEASSSFAELGLIAERAMAAAIASTGGNAEEAWPEQPQTILTAVGTDRNEAAQGADNDESPLSSTASGVAGHFSRSAAPTTAAAESSGSAARRSSGRRPQRRPRPGEAFSRALAGSPVRGATEQPTAEGRNSSIWTTNSLLPLGDSDSERDEDSSSFVAPAPVEASGGGGGGLPAPIPFSPPVLAAQPWSPSGFSTTRSSGTGFFVPPPSSGAVSSVQLSWTGASPSRYQPQLPRHTPIQPTDAGLPFPVHADSATPHLHSRERSSGASEEGGGGEGRARRAGAPPRFTDTISAPASTAASAGSSPPLARRWRPTERDLAWLPCLGSMTVGVPAVHEGPAGVLSVVAWQESKDGEGLAQTLEYCRATGSANVHSSSRLAVFSGSPVGHARFVLGRVPGPWNDRRFPAADDPARQEDSQEQNSAWDRFRAVTAAAHASVTSEENFALVMAKPWASRLRDSFVHHRDASERERMVLRLDRTSQTTFDLEFRYPFSPVQALGVVLARLDALRSAQHERRWMPAGEGTAAALYIDGPGGEPVRRRSSFASASSGGSLGSRVWSGLRSIVRPARSQPAPSVHDY